MNKYKEVKCSASNSLHFSHYMHRLSLITGLINSVLRETITVYNEEETIYPTMYLSTVIWVVLMCN